MHSIGIAADSREDFRENLKNIIQEFREYVLISNANSEKKEIISQALKSILLTPQSQRRCTLKGMVVEFEVKLGLQLYAARKARGSRFKRLWENLNTFANKYIASKICITKEDIDAVVSQEQNEFIITLSKYIETLDEKSPLGAVKLTYARAIKEILTKESDYKTKLTDFIRLFLGREDEAKKAIAGIFSHRLYDYARRIYRFLLEQQTTESGNTVINNLLDVKGWGPVPSVRKTVHPILDKAIVASMMTTTRSDGTKEKWLALRG